MVRREPVERFYVVGLGASAGGLEALRDFFAAVPAESGAAFVVIQHLAPTHRSQMVELLASHTTVAVSQIEDGVMIRPDHIYVIPPGKWVRIFRGSLFLRRGACGHAEAHDYRCSQENCPHFRLASILHGPSPSSRKVWAASSTPA